MKVSKNTILITLAAACMASVASAQCPAGNNGLCVGAVGSSAQFQSAMLAAYDGLPAGAGHYTIGNGGQIIDNRGDLAIVAQTGNLAVVWDNAAAPTQVFFYLSVDSVVGNRAYFSQPRATLNVINPLAAPSNSISAALWGADALSIPAAVLAIIQGAQFTAAATDILPADAKFAQNRVNCGTGNTASIGCLGYGTPNDPNVGTQIMSEITPGTQAQPVNFNIFGNDPISGNAIPAYTVVPVGIAPIVFITNRTNASGLGTGVSATSGGIYDDMTYQASALELFTGADCDSSALIPDGTAPPNFAITPILREPLSGTMNTFEFNIMVTNAQGYVGTLSFSQESNFPAGAFSFLNLPAIQPGAANSNPLNLACGLNSNYAVGPQGNRLRAVGTGDVVKGVQNTQDSIGYIFFSYGNVSKIAASTKYGYMRYGLNDPIIPTGNYNTPCNIGGTTLPCGDSNPADVGKTNNGPVWNGYGQLPTCAAPCPITPGTSFPNIRSSAYQAWSVLRCVADSGTNSLTNLQALAAAEANEVNGKQPDFLRFNPTSDGDPGFFAYRLHFAPTTPIPNPYCPSCITLPIPVTSFNFNAGNQWNNGPQLFGGNTYNPGTTEAGGDVGGCLDYKTDAGATNFPFTIPGSPSGCRQ